MALGSRQVIEPASISPTPKPVAAEWPMFRGNARLTGVAASELPVKLELIWRFSSPDREPFTSTAAIVSGRVYVGCEDGRLYALNLDDGTLRWTYKTADAAIKSSPTVYGDLVLFGDESGEFHAVDSASGAKAWTFKAEGEIVSSANPYHDRVVFGSFDGCIYCLAIRDGTLLWKFKTDAQVFGTVGITEGKAVVAGCDGKLRVLNMDDGAEVRSAAVGAQTAASPAILDHRVFLGTLGNQVLCIDWKAGKTDWTYENPDRAFPFHASAAVTNDLVIIGGRDKTVHGLDPATGRSRWVFRTQGRVDSSPVIVGDRVFFGSADGRLYALSLKTGREVWQFEAGMPISASPAVAGGRLVIGDEDGTMYCFGAKPAAK